MYAVRFKRQIESDENDPVNGRNQTDDDGTLDVETNDPGPNDLTSATPDEPDTESQTDNNAPSTTAQAEEDDDEFDDDDGGAGDGDNDDVDEYDDDGEHFDDFDEADFDANADDDDKDDVTGPTFNRYMTRFGRMMKPGTRFADNMMHIILTLIAIVGWFALLGDGGGTFLLGDWKQHRVRESIGLHVKTPIELEYFVRMIESVKAEEDVTL